MLLEAMSCGIVPVLKEGTGPAFLRHGQNAFFFRGQDEACGIFLASLLEGRARLAAVRAGARGTVLEHFDQNKAVPQHMRLLLDAYAAWKGQQPLLA